MCKSFLRRTCHQTVSTLLEIKSLGAGPKQKEISTSLHHRGHTPARTHTHTHIYIYKCMLTNKGFLFDFTGEMSGRELDSGRKSPYTSFFTRSAILAEKCQRAGFLKKKCLAPNVEEKPHSLWYT